MKKDKPTIKDFSKEINKIEQSVRERVKTEVEEELSELKEFLTEEEFKEAVEQEVDYRCSLTNPQLEKLTESLTLLMKMIDEFKKLEE